LLWMGWGILRDAGFSKVKLEFAATGSTQSIPLELTGILVSLSNPYWTIWWATIGLGYITVAYNQGIGALITFYLGHISADFLWYALVSLGITSGKKFISDKVYRGILLVCGFFLIGLAVYFIYSGVKFI